MGYTVYIDESRTHSGPAVLGLGALVVPDANLARFEAHVSAAKARHGVTSEAKWKDVRNSHGLMNFCLEILHDVASPRCSGRLSVMLIEKAKYRLWAQNKEQAFYKAMTLLVKNCAHSFGSLSVRIDQRSDAYPKHHEVVQKVANHMLLKVSDSGTVEECSRVDSRGEVGIQVIDCLVGAFAAAREAYIRPGQLLNPGQALVLSRMAEVLGWPGLHHDTKPNDAFNVWHFPEECRGNPRSLDVHEPREPNWISPTCLAAARARHSQSDGTHAN